MVIKEELVTRDKKGCNVEGGIYLGAVHLVVGRLCFQNYAYFLWDEIRPPPYLYRAYACL